MNVCRAGRWWKPCVVVLVGAFVGTIVPAIVQAQTPVPVASTVLKATVADLEKGPHVGPVETALVGLEIYGRHGNGFVLRCDGFLVVPFDLFNLADDQTTPNLTITFAPGSGHEQKLTMPRRSRTFIENRRIQGFTVFHVDGAIHVPALRTMLPDSLKPGPEGDTVEVVWSAWDAGAKRFGPVQKRRVALASLPPTETPEQKQAAEDAARKRPGFVRFAEPLAASDGVPAGAVVLGPEGMAIGVVPGGAAGAVRDGFVSFSILNDVTNCVTPVPGPDSRFRPVQSVVQPATDGEGEGEKKPVVGGRKLEIGRPGQDEMVSVPGGPVIVPRSLLAEQADMEGEPIACMAPFQIDKYEVTNQQYKAFWNSALQSLSETERNDPNVIVRLHQLLFPLGWAPEGDPYPAEIGNLPVIGVPVIGAKAYAKWAGKRLPTPYEWAKAALGARGETQTPEWIQRYIQARQLAWRELVTEHRDYIRQHPEILRAEAEQHRNDTGFTPAKSAFFKFPWIYVGMPDGRGNPPFGYEKRFSKEVTTRIADSLMTDWKDPIFMLDVGSRAYDVSPYGAMDMLLNANEMYMPNPSGPVFGAMRFAHLGWLRGRETENEPSAFFSTFASLVPPEFSGPIASPEDQRRFSRLYKRLIRQRYKGGARLPIPIEVALIMSNIDDVKNMVYPIANWQLRVGKQYEITGDVTPETSFALIQIGERAEILRTGAARIPGLLQATDAEIQALLTQFGPWQDKLLRYPHVETGWPSALQGTLLMLPQRGDADPNYSAQSNTFGSHGIAREFFYILPVGFRCAR